MMDLLWMAIIFLEDNLWRAPWVLSGGLFYGVAWYTQFRYFEFKDWWMRSDKPTTILVSPMSAYWWYQPQMWKNKYKNRRKEDGPAFPGSTWIFVWVTDSFHFFQMLAIWMSCSGYSGSLIEGFFWSQVFRTVFTLSFRGTKLLIRKCKKLKSSSSS